MLKIHLNSWITWSQHHLEPLPNYHRDIRCNECGLGQSGSTGTWESAVVNSAIKQIRQKAERSPKVSRKCVDDPCLYILQPFNTSSAAEKTSAVLLPTAPSVVGVLLELPLAPHRNKAETNPGANLSTKIHQIGIHGCSSMLLATFEVPATDFNWIAVTRLQDYLP